MERRGEKDRNEKKVERAQPCCHLHMGLLTAILKRQNASLQEWVYSAMHSEYSSLWGCIHTSKRGGDAEGHGKFIHLRTLGIQKPVEPFKLNRKVWNRTMPEQRL